MKDFIYRTIDKSKSWVDYVFSQMSELMVVVVTFLWSVLFFALVIFTRTGRTVTVLVGGICMIIIWLYLAYKFYNYAISLSKDKGKHKINLEYDDIMKDSEIDFIETDPSPETYQLSFDDYYGQNEEARDDEGG